MGAAYSSLGQTKVLYVTSLVLLLVLGAKTKFLLRKPSFLVAKWKRFRRHVDLNPFYQRW